MTKFMISWRANPNAQWPIDPAALMQLNEMMFAGIDDALKAVTSAFLHFSVSAYDFMGSIHTCEEPVLYWWYVV